MKNNYEAIFFDLDGTLLDTAPDLYASMCLTLKQLGHTALPTFSEFRPHIHTGTRSMIQGSLNIDEQDPSFPKLRKIFLNYYQTRLHQKTDYFPGIPVVLNSLDQQKIPWGIITNKPHFLTQPLLDSFQLTQRSQCIISGDTLSRKKPYPDPLLHACELVQVKPQQSVYIGDTQSDVIAAKAAKMTAIAVLYGYHDPKSQPHSWGADYLIETPQDILELLMS